MLRITWFRSITRPSRFRCSGPSTRFRMLQAAGTAAATAVPAAAVGVPRDLTDFTGRDATVLVLTGVALWTSMLSVPRTTRRPAAFTRVVSGLKLPVTRSPVLVTPRIPDVVASSPAGAIKEARGATAAARGAEAWLTAPAEPDTDRTTARDT